MEVIIIFWIILFLKTKWLVLVKKAIALAQTYFVIQTRKQELSEKEYNELTEDEKRL